jgi:peptide/nickel transport system permease protein
MMSAQWTAARDTKVWLPNFGGWRFGNRNPAVSSQAITGVLGVGILGFLGALALFGPSLWLVNPEAQDLANRLAPPLGFGATLSHPLGTDSLGRDTLARLIAGARVTLALAGIATLAAAVIGVSLGLLAGYRGGATERVIVWLSEVQLAIPFVVFAVATTAAFGPSARNMLLTLIVTGWVAYAGVVRFDVKSMRGAAWMDAARAIGAPEHRIFQHHLLPNLSGPILVLATQQAGAMILYESSLSFLGLGLSSSTTTWGGMVALGRDALFKAPWVAAVPGAAIALVILGCNLCGDWLAARGRGRN